MSKRERKKPGARSPQLMTDDARDRQIAFTEGYRRYRRREAARPKNWSEDQIESALVGAAVNDGEIKWDIEEPWRRTPGEPLQLTSIFKGQLGSLGQAFWGDFRELRDQIDAQYPDDDALDEKLQAVDCFIKDLLVLAFIDDNETAKQLFYRMRDLGMLQDVKGIIARKEAGQMSPADVGAIKLYERAGSFEAAAAQLCHDSASLPAAKKAFERRYKQAIANLVKKGPRPGFEDL